MRSDPNREDRHTDRVTFLWLTGFMLLSLVIRILSYSTEFERTDGVGMVPVGHVVIFETSSTLVLIALIPMVAALLSRASPGQHGTTRVALVHVAGVTAYSLIHVLCMAALRKLSFAAFGLGQYDFMDASAPLREFIYEYRKDIFSYLLTAMFLLMSRQLAEQRRELATIRQEARSTQRLALKSGGQTHWIDGQSVRYVKAAGNYVEVHAAGAPVLARTTLNAIEQTLRDAGVGAVRLHRSYVVNRALIRRTVPNGEGDLQVELDCGAVIPCSRRYREQLDAPVAA
ncbi:LytTR family DNA-binding domain-containing protein [Parvularcula sp. LCG005]|uniref:LytR/AlgR family response regulator transcription factor n=1 Tax=Parvularcula sp. LCG005 TaxID=3078805 RepID=UPI002943E5C2|nr:LytTR family DNA-binding domain-containing protein [Parvularcula sp. LCG005]WOI53513.1 LytTR family DNA-binding domain-containing protein [Parvularcula sp. LCG005]